jgi:hypothetical protein
MKKNKIKVNVFSLIKFLDIHTYIVILWIIFQFKLLRIPPPPKKNFCFLLLFFFLLGLLSYCFLRGLLDTSAELHLTPIYNYTCYNFISRKILNYIKKLYKQSIKHIESIFGATYIFDSTDYIIWQASFYLVIRKTQEYL